MSPSDQSIVHRVLSGDTDAFGTLVDRYSSRVYGVIFEVVRRVEDAEDISQEVFCKAFEQIGQLRESRKFGAWLGRLASNMAIDWVRDRRMKRRAEELLEGDATEGTIAFPPYHRTPEQLLDSSENMRMLWKSLDRLTPELRRTVVLFHIQGCSYKDIAQFLDMRRSTVKMRLYRAKVALRRELEVLHLEEARLETTQARQMKKTVMTALPLLPLLEPPAASASPAHPSWERVLKWGPSVGLAGLIGLAGFELEKKWNSQDEDNSPAGSGLRIRREVVELPGISVTAFPAKPQAGQQVRLEFAGPELPASEYAELHYIVELSAVQDNVIPMTWDGESWTAELTIPEQAAVVLYYPTTQMKGQEKLNWRGVHTRARLFAQFRYALLVHTEHGDPVRGAVHALSKHALKRGASAAEILELLENEVRRYPDNFEAQGYRLEKMALAGEGDRVELIRASLEDRFKDEPEYLYWSAQGDRGSIQNLVELVRRFPQHTLAPVAQFEYAIALSAAGEPGLAAEAFREFVERFPDGRRAHHAFRRFLTLTAQTDQGLALSIADSLIEGVFELSPGDRTDSDPFFVVAGVLPEALARAVEVELLMGKGDSEGVERASDELISSGVPDPYPYLYVGERLAQGLRGFLLPGTQYKTNPELAHRVLEAGEPFLEVSAIDRLPGFTKGRSENGKRIEVVKFFVRQLQRRYAKALSDRYLAQKEYDKAMSVLGRDVFFQEEESQFLDWDLQGVYLNLARAYRAQGSWKKAQNAYFLARKALRANIW